MTHCVHVTLPNGQQALVRVSGKRRKAAKCRYCDVQHTLLCDHELEGGKTCDQKLCVGHATQVGPDRHMCPEHRQ